MPSYIYIESGSDRRGMNRNIRVYRIVKNVPVAIGTEDWNSASWAGASGTARAIIAKKEGYKTGEHGWFVRKDIKITEV
jgi:hypothetical protein